MYLKRHLRAAPHKGQERLMTSGALGFVLAVVTFGHLLHAPLYEFHTHVIPRLALVLFVFLLPREDDRFSVERLLRKVRRG